MKSTTARRFGSSGKSFTAPSAVAPTIGAALLASGTSETADTAWSPSAACLLPDILPVAGTLLSYGGSRQLASGGTVTHSGALTLGGALTLPGNPSSALHAAPKQYVDSAVGAIDLSGLVPYTGATGAVNLGSNGLTTTGTILASKIGNVDELNQIVFRAGNVWNAITERQLRDTSWGFWDGYPAIRTSSAAILIARGGQVYVPGTASFGFGSSVSSGADVHLYRGGAGILAQRNGINAQCLLLSKSYTSDTSQEALMLDAGKQISGKLGLYSYRGSSGGSNYPIQIGMLAADGSTFSGLSIATTGLITIGDNLLTPYNCGLTFPGGEFVVQDSQGGQRLMVSGPWNLINAVGSTIAYGIGDNYYTPAIKLGRSTTSWVAMCDGGFKIRNLADSADAALTCGAITASGTITLAGDYLSYPRISTAGNLVFYARDANRLRLDTSGVTAVSIGSIGFNSGTNLDTGSQDAYFVRNAASSIGLKGSGGIDAALTCGAITANGNLTLSDTNLITGTTTGTIIATANSQKLGFWGATPIVQPTTSVAAATLVSNLGTPITSTDTFDGYTLQQIARALRLMGKFQ